MPATPKILGQYKPVPVTYVTLFSVQPSTTVEFSIFINNQGTTYDGYSIALVPAGQTLLGARELAHNTQIAAGDTHSFSGLYLNSGDTVFVSSSLGNCAFTATGIEFS